MGPLCVVGDLAWRKPQSLILDSGCSPSLADQAVLRVCRNYINNYAAAIKLASIFAKQRRGLPFRSPDGTQIQFELIM